MLFVAAASEYGKDIAMSKYSVLWLYVPFFFVVHLHTASSQSAVGVTVRIDQSSVGVGDDTVLRVFAEIESSTKDKASQIFSWYIDLLNDDETIAELDYEQLVMQSSDNVSFTSSSGSSEGSHRRGIFNTFLNLAGAGKEEPVELLAVPVIAVAEGLATFRVQAGTTVGLAADFLVAPIVFGEPFMGGDYTGAVAELTVSGASRIQALDVAMRAPDDDAEEDLASGTVSISSSDLELGEERGGAPAAQRVGLRFPSVELPDGSSIKAAFLQFSAEERSVDSSSIILFGERIEDAPSFGERDRDLSSRETTAARVVWEPEPWRRVGASGELQRTPNLASLLQEIIDLSGWKSGNAVVILMEGSGRRTAAAFEHGSLAPPSLHIQYFPPEEEFSSFDAYNDLSWSEDQTSENITLYTTDSGPGAPPQGSSGFLVNYDTGEELEARLMVEGGTWNGAFHASVGAGSRAGSEGHMVFDGILDPRGVVNYAASDLVLTLSGLNRSLRYELTLFGNRDNPFYTDRLSKIVLSGAEAFLNISSEAANFDGRFDSSTILGNGSNTEQGLVARYSEIDPGEDGEIVLTVTDGGSARPPKFYANALKVSAGLPSEEIAPFTAYNDLSWGEGQLSKNITRYTTDNVLGVSPEGFSGPLTDYLSGEQLPISVTVTGGFWNQTVHSIIGEGSNSGTDAHTVFQGRLDSTGVINYGDPVVLTFEGLHPLLQYEVVAFGNRANPAYTDRLSRTAISGVEAFRNESTVGADFLNMSDEGTVVVTGFNTINGFVSRFTGIDPGPDGRFQLIHEDGGSRRPPRHYINAFMLRGTRRVITTDTTGTRTFSLANPGDDAEEVVSDGEMNLSSGDLELVDEGGEGQVVGLRFSDVTLPKEATILSASVQFTVDEVSRGSSALLIEGEAADNAAPFSGEAGDLSARTRTSRSQAWSPRVWVNVGEAKERQKTPDLSTILQEIVTRDGWSSGNALVLLFTGSGKRTAVSRDSSLEKAAVLRVEYETAP